MDKKEILQFEEDDASRMGVNGKQVFFTKRINGKTTHNKLEDEDSIKLEENKDTNNNIEEELFIEFKNPQYHKEDTEEENNEKENKKENKKAKNSKKKNIKKKKITKAQKRRKKRKRIIRVVVLFLIILGITIFTMVSPIFNIDNIEVSGVEKIQAETIVSLSKIQKGKNIFQINKKHIIKNIKENPYIEEASIKRKLPGTIQIDIKERAVAYQIKVINSFVYIDYQGYILEIASKNGGVPFVEGITTDQDTLLNGKRLLNSDLETLNALLKIMDAAKGADISKKITKIIIKDDEYKLELKKENKEAYLGNATNLTNKILYVKLILEKEKGNEGKIFVNGDLNSGFKPYFREKEKTNQKEE